MFEIAIGGGNDVVLIPEHKDASGIYAVLKQSVAGAASRTDVPGYDGFTLKATLPHTYSVEQGLVGGSVGLAFQFHALGGDPGVWSDSYAGQSRHDNSSSNPLEELYRVYHNNVYFTNNGSALLDRPKILVVFSKVTEGQYLDRVVALVYIEGGAQWGLSQTDLTAAGIDTDLTVLAPARYARVTEVSSSEIAIRLSQQGSGQLSMYTDVANALSNTDTMTVQEIENAVSS